MSKIITVDIRGAKIVYKDLELLRKALEDCIKASHGSWINAVGDYRSSNVANVEVGIKTAEFERGIGFIQVGDHYEAKADFYNMQRQGETLLKQIARNYQKHANLAVLGEMHFIPTVTQQQTGNEIMITARQY